VAWSQKGEQIFLLLLSKALQQFSGINEIADGFDLLYRGPGNARCLSVNQAENDGAGIVAEDDSLIISPSFN